MYRFWLLIITICFNCKALAQKEANLWFFGRQASIDFNQSPPNSSTFNLISTDEGCAVISDKNGHLLFYTDGRKVWNKNHEKMPNGENLLGGPSATQAALIVPYPNHPSLFFIFTPGEYSDALFYSLVDISKENGLGDVVSKNIQLLSNATEKVTGVKHKNNKDYWVITHNWNNNEFIAWCITDKGLTPPVKSSVGSYIGGSTLNARGYLKISPNGNQLACAVTVPDNFLEIFDFNNVTGQVTNPRKVTGFENGGPYGVEFSPNGKYLYVSEAVGGGIFDTESNMYQIAAPYVTGDISNIGFFISKVVTCALQCGPDGRIYVANKLHTIHVLNNPNERGTNCNFQQDAINVGKDCAFGLPNFIQSYFKEPFSILADGKCSNHLTNFELSSELSIDSVLWEFGDGKSEISKNFKVTHTYIVSGMYVVTAKVFHDNIITFLKYDIQILGSPKIRLGNDTTLTYGQQLILTVNNINCNYIWNTGDTTSKYTITAPGKYFVTAINANGCSSSDTILVSYNQPLTVALPKDTTICPGQSIKLDISLNGATYEWSNGDTKSAVTINTPGIYWVKITNFYRTLSKIDTITIVEKKFSRIEFIGDTVICEPSEITLTIKNKENSTLYNWYDASGAFIEQNDRIFKRFITKSTIFFVEPTNDICSGQRQKITIIMAKTIAKITASNTVVEIGMPIKLLGSGGIRYDWRPKKYLDNDKIANPIVIPLDDQIYTLTVVNEYGCIDSTTIFIKIKKSLNIPTAFTPNSDGVNDYWEIKNIERYPDNKVSIYNRYGIMVANYSNYSNNWDGNYAGRPLPTDTYFYIIRYNHLILSGNVLIIR